MKNTYCILVFCLFFSLYESSAQTSNPDISINLTNQIFFEFVPYPLTLNIGDNTDSYIVEGDDHSLIIIDSNQQYSVVFYGEFYRSTITLYKTVNGEKVKAFSKLFSFKPLPITPVLKGEDHPFPWTVSGRYISKEKLRQVVVSAGFINYDIEKFFEVISYSMIIPVNGSIREFKITGDQIGENQFEYIENLKSGQPIIFDKIRIKGYEEFGRVIYPFVIYLE